MLESEAKKLTCWRHDSKCIGAQCMAWKWGRLHDPRERELWSKSKNKRVNSALTVDSDWRLVDATAQLPEQHGTCSALNDCGHF